MGGFRRFIIRTADVLMLVLVVLITLASAISMGGSLQMTLGGIYGVLGFILGAVLGFIGAAIVAAYFFLLAEIAENTRRP
jgi:hypothetical protein